MKIKDKMIILSYPGLKYPMSRMNKRIAILILLLQKFLTATSRAAACPPSSRKKILHRMRSKTKKSARRDNRAAEPQRALASKIHQK